MQAPELPSGEIGKSIHASLQHIALLKQREERLAAAREEAMAQVLHRIGSAHRCGEITDRQLFAVFKTVKAAKVPLSRWDEHVSIPWRRMLHLPMHLPNGPEGSWFGAWPDETRGPWPRDGQPVVYVLFDAANEPCYVGSSKNLYARLKAHAKDGKDFARWQAHPCRDREHAYLLEDRLLKEHKPRLNRKAGR